MWGEGRENVQEWGLDLTLKIELKCHITSEKAEPPGGALSHRHPEPTKAFLTWPLPASLCLNEHIS